VAPADEAETLLPRPGRPVDAETQAQLPPLVALPADEWPTVPGYDILDELGRGGMGVVYKARHIALKRLVALKMILSGAHAGPQELARFRTEAEAVARLQHPNIVQIYEVGEHEGRPFFSLEFVAGGSLASRLDGTPWPIGQAVHLVETLARAVHTAHRGGIVHRDLKPANILLVSGALVSGEWSGSRTSDHLPLTAHQSPLTPKVTDFGLAKRLEAATAQTQSGAILGTPTYMAPEQAGGQSKEVGPAADIYALGVLLYELLTGRPPFQAATPLDTVLLVLSEDPLPPGRLRPKLPRDLDTVCLKCLEKEPRRRYPTAEALAEDLRRYLACEPVQARPAAAWERGLKWVRRRPAVAALLGVVVLATLALVAGGAWSYWRIAAALAEAKRQRGEAEQQRTEAERQRDQAATNLEQARRNLYAAHMNVAQHALEDGDSKRVARLLDAQRPKAGEEDLRGFEWFRLWRLLHPAARPGPDTLLGHTARVSSLAFSPARRTLATGGRDLTVKLWDLDTGQVKTTLSGHTLDVISLAFSPDGHLLVSTSGDIHDRKDVRPGEIKVWDVAAGRELASLGGHGSYVSAVSFSPDGKTLVTSGSYDQAVKVWDVAARKLQTTLVPDRTPLPFERTGNPEVDRQQGMMVMAGMFMGPILSLAFSPDGKLLATGSWNQTVRLWDTRTWTQVALIGTSSGVECVAFSPDGATLATAQGGGVQLWDVSTRKLRSSLQVYDSWVHSLAYSPDGRTLVTGSKDRAVKLWDPVTGLERVTLKGHTEAVRCVAFSPDGTTLATGSEDKSVRLWHAAPERETKP
jgi:WD40 repeat protein